jgi:TctA family transporter
MLETQSILTHEISGGSFSYVLQRPAAMVLMAIMALSLISTALSKRRQSRRAEVENAAVLS